MKRFFQENGGLVLLAGLLLTAILSMCIYIFDFNPFAGILEVVATPFRYVSTILTRWTEDRYEERFRYEELEAENKALRERIAELEENARNGEIALQENERLKDLLGLAEARPELSYQDAEVTRRSTSNWESTLMIDRGTADGVSLDDCVIDQYGYLVGVVTETGLNWSIVTTILDPACQMGGRVARADTDAMLEGDFTLMLEGRLSLSYVSQSASLMAGDQVTTSGMGGVYPPDILVGTLLTLDTQEDGISWRGEVQPSADIDEVRFVYVIVDFDGGG